MKTTPMHHQQTGLARLAAAPEFYALGAEQGTGKTWMLLADAERQFAERSIDGLLVIAPKGVHTNWVKREMPVHLACQFRATAWTGDKTKKSRAALAALMRVECGEELAVFTINIDALNTTSGLTATLAFLGKFRSMVVVDESHHIKNPDAKRTKTVHSLADVAVSRRIMSGTLVANGPLDLYSQYHFLSPGLLGTTSYRAFVAEYAELLPRSHPLVANARGNPQIVRRDALGRPAFRNLAKLRQLVAPHTFRVLKSECLDLPPKVYSSHFFDLTPPQRRAYDKLREELLYERHDGNIDTFTALTIIGKLRQVTSGFLLVDGEPVQLACSERLKALRACLEDVDGQVIIWAHYREELRQIKAILGAAAVEYHGGINTNDREQAIDRFQSGTAQYFVANPASGGTGLTLTAAKAAIYYSNDFSLSQRLQSEDRCHRIGTAHSVLYIDIVATDTIDERITAALQSKQDVAAAVMQSGFE